MDTPYLCVQRRDHPVLLVAFSHINTPKGAFAQYRVLSALPYATIFLNCPDNGYYLRPIPGVGDSVASISARLRAEIEALSPMRVVFFGNSMGAYGALLYGALIGADLTLALGPEVLLGIAGGAMLRAAKDKTLAADPHARQLPALLRQVQRGERVCLFGEKAIADMRGALALGGGGTQAMGIRNAFHSVAPYLHGTTGLTEVIADVVEHGAASPLLAAQAGDLLASPALIRELYALAHENAAIDDPAQLMARIAPGASLETVAYAWLAWGRRLLARGAGRSALPFLLAAASANPGDIEAYALLVRLPAGRRLARAIPRAPLIAAVRAHRFDPVPAYSRFLAALMIEGEATPPAVLEAIAGAGLSASVEAQVALALAELLALHGEWGRAEAAARSGCARLPGDGFACARLAEVLIGSGRREQALAVVSAALERDGGHGRLLALRARLQAELGLGAAHALAGGESVPTAP